MTAVVANKLEGLLKQFVQWLDGYGPVSQDQYDFWSFPPGQKAKAVYYKNAKLGGLLVAPFFFLESFAPATRKWFTPPRRFAIADAHYAMGFLFLHRATGATGYYDRGRSYLEELIRSRCPGYEHYCWGYPFEWETCFGTFHAGTPLITTVPYVYEAFRDMYEVDGSERWLEIVHSIAEHVYHDYTDADISATASAASYSPFDKRMVLNANAYRAYIMTEASIRFNNDAYWKKGERNINYILEVQNPDGSWFYATDGKDRFIDNYHTCFNLKNLAKIDALKPSASIQESIRRGVEYYLSHLVDEHRLPVPFAKKPRITLHKRELYDYAEFLNMSLLLRDRFAELNEVRQIVFDDFSSQWIKPDGSFRTRKLLFGWNNVPYHRWAQSQMFRSLAFWYHLEREAAAMAEEKVPMREWNHAENADVRN